jgi:anti-anti-sigma factor
MVRVIRENGVTILCTGPSYAALEYQVLQELGEVLLSEATHATPPRLILDMSETSYVGSSFIEILVRAWKRIQNRHGMMALCTLHPFCHEVISVSRLDTIWPIYANRAEASNALAAISGGV